MTLRRSLEALETREVPTASLQIIHNSPFPAVAKVDVYINGNLFLDNLPFQSATAFLQIASQENLVLDITDAAAANNNSPLLTTTLNFPDNAVTAAVLVGQPGTASFRLAQVSARNGATNPNKVDFAVMNGTPDQASLDIVVRSLGLVGNDRGLGQFGSYVSVTPDNYILDARPASGGLNIASTKLNLADHKGDAVLIMTSGLKASTEVIGIFNDGTSVTFLKQVDPAYAAGTLTAQGGAAILASTFGDTALAVVAFPNATSPARVAAADLNGDGTPDLIIGSGPGFNGVVRIVNGKDGTLLDEFAPFGMFAGGINVAAGDLTGDGVADYAISPDFGGGPRVRIFNGATGAQIADFFGIDDVNFRGGARCAIGDLNGDKRGDLLVSAGTGGGPRIATYNGLTLGLNGGPKFNGDFFAFEPELRNGAYIAAGDINGDGFDDMIVGGGPGGGPRVRVFDGKFISAEVRTQSVLADFFAGDINERLGARVAARDLDGDGRDDLITGGVPGGSAATRIFLAPTLPLNGIADPTAVMANFDGSAPLGEVFVG